MQPLSRNSSRFVTSPFLAFFCFASLIAYSSVSAAQETKSNQEIPLYFPPPLVVEPLPPRTPPEDELERDPGGILVLPNTPANDVSGSCSDDLETNACAQNETALAINPTNNDNWVGGANDYSGPIMLDGRAQASCGFYSSNDSGQTWSGGLLPTQDGFTGGGDPSLAFDSDGNVYYACLNFELTLPGHNLGQSGLYVFKSTNGGQTFAAPTEVITGTGLTDFHDKQFITTGALTNKIYLGWMHQGDIRLTGSDDAGASFNSPTPVANVEINDPTNNTNQGVVLATLGFPNPEGPDGEAIYAAWVDLDQNRILFDASTDGGMTFGNDVVVEGSKVFDGKLPAPVIDGYVKIVSDRRLVVSGVYTTATLNAEGTAEDHSSIHIEAAVERKLENLDENPLLADLVVDDDFSIDANCEDRRCRISLRFTVRNVGAGVAGPFTVDIARNQPIASLANVSVPAGLAPAAAFADSVTVDYQLNQNDPKKLCVKADHPTNAVNESNEINNERCFGF